MADFGPVVSHVGLPFPTHNTYWNLTPPDLYEQAIRRGEATLSEGGPLVAVTSPHTGRSPGDKFVVAESSSEQDIWWGKVNQRFDAEKFAALKQRMLAYVHDHDMFVQDCFIGADPRYRLPVRIANEYAWHSLFVQNMFRPASPAEQAHHDPQFTIINAPHFHADPARDGTRSETFIILNFGERTVLIGGTQYAGETKKSVFTIMNYLLPLRGVMPMHCSANIGKDGSVAIFFGLSGTGKTTLSADPERTLIGDDEHGWSDEGVFNFEGGCYAKVIKLSPTAEPEIYATTHMFGTVLENVIVDPNTRKLDLDDESITENTRGCYPISFIPNATPTGMGGHPRNIIFLTADAFGVLPPISKLSVAQARYHFLSGYTAKVAGTERGVTEPQPNFSTCFGAPFLPLKPNVYSKLLGEKIAQHRVNVWLLNTGWSGGPYGVGSRMKIAYTRAMVRAALNGSLDDVA
ncbi:MAG TPA: phosphoenolpyruvate carboxykinase (ATP), partial [Anaerolineae bacterium]